MGRWRTASKAVLVTGAGTGPGLATAEVLAAMGYRVHAGSATRAATRGSAPPACIPSSSTPPTGRASPRPPRRCGPPSRRACSPPRSGDGSSTSSGRRASHGPSSLPLLRRGAGRIVDIRHAHGPGRAALLGPLSAGKAAVESLSDALRIELAPWGTAVVVVGPGRRGDAAAAVCSTGADARGMSMLAGLPAGRASA